MQEEFGKIKVLITKSTYAHGILIPQTVILRVFNHPSSLGIADFGFDIPWASVLLVLKQGGRCHGY